MTYQLEVWLFQLRHCQVSGVQRQGWEVQECDVTLLTLHSTEPSDVEWKVADVTPEIKSENMEQDTKLSNAPEESIVTKSLLY